MELIALTLRTLPTTEQRLGYLEDRVRMYPNDVEAWLYLADHYLYIDLQKTIHAWQHIAQLRPSDECVQTALHLIRQLDQSVYQ